MTTEVFFYLVSHLVIMLNSFFFRFFSLTILFIDRFVYLCSYFGCAYVSVCMCKNEFESAFFYATLKMGENDEKKFNTAQIKPMKVLLNENVDSISKCKSVDYLLTLAPEFLTCQHILATLDHAIIQKSWFWL